LEPLGESDDISFSMYGYLDASADTQWVRITPLRDQLELSSEIPDIDVTIENMETGQTVVMTDSLFKSGNDLAFLNFWSAERIDHNQAYRIRAEGMDGETSEVTVVTPEELSTPIVRRETSYGGPTTYSVMVDEDVNLADVQTKYYVRIHSINFESKKVFSFAYRNIAEKIEAYGGVYNILIYPDDEIEEIKRRVLLPVDGEIEVVHRQIYVASSGTEWNKEIETMDELTYALPEGLNNIENGVGYMIGIDSKIVPYASCENDDGVFIACDEEDVFW
jgi:hypothetical protein